MKKKLTIALAAILTISLLLAGCAVTATPAETGLNETARYGNANASVDSVQVGAGYRGGSGSTESYGGGYGAESGYYYSDDCDPINDGTATADPNYTLTEQDQTLSLAGYGSEGALNDTALTLADMLTYAIQDEYLARAEYVLIMDEYGSIRPFTNIMKAEGTHVDALLPLFETYGIAAPADEGASHAVSVPSLTNAYEAGVNAEVNNIAMYETFLEQNLPSDVRTVFESLMHASENHLRAFQNQL